MSIAPGTEAYQLRLPIFEGPLDLLLHLIEREELDITAIALVSVTDQYLQYLHEAEQLNLDALADFIAIGARLIYLKSRALLPRPPAAPGEEEEEDPGDELARQLREYKLFKEAASRLRDIETAGLHAYPRIAPPPEFPPPTGLDGVTLDLLQQIVESVLTRKPEQAEPVQVIRPHKVTVREKIDRIRELIASSPHVSFRALVEECRTRMEVVVSFMAVLELIKSRVIDAVQDATFADIVLVPTDEAPLAVEVTSEFDDQD
ncbi:MAG TPA: ScpA family protein [Dehalococcoidia bacterium]|nr:ScpA family protein [Dehalococcoidia bacterium]